MDRNQPKTLDFLQLSVVVNLEIRELKVPDILTVLIPYDDRHFYQIHRGGHIRFGSWLPRPEN